MRKIIISSLAAVLLIANANAGVYVSGYLSTIRDGERVENGNTIKDRIDLFDDLMLDYAVGYAFESGFRIEADVLSIGLISDKESFKNSFGWNLGIGAVKGLYDFKMQSGMIPYMGAGVSNFSYENSDMFLNLDMVGVIGIKYAINQKMAVDLQYNWVFDYADSDNSKETYNAQNVLKLGMVYSF